MKREIPLGFPECCTTERAWDVVSSPFVKLMVYTVPTMEICCLKKLADFKIVTQKQDHHLMSKKLFTLQVAAFEEKALGPRAESRVGTGRGTGTQEEAAVCIEARHWPKGEISHFSRSHPIREGRSFKS